MTIRVCPDREDICINGIHCKAPCAKGNPMTADHDKLITVGAGHKSPCEVVERVRNELLTRSLKTRY